MKRIYGRVLVRETNAGIADLQVAVFDVERADEARHELLLLRGDGENLDGLPNRLGSVLTDANGNFDLPIDETLVQRVGRDRTPDLVVAVFAPEDSAGPEQPQPAPDKNRLLHLSRAPRFKAGLVEAYVIRIPQQQLEAFAIPMSQGPRVAPHDEAARFANVVSRRWAVKDAIKERLGTELKGRARLLQQSQTKAKNIFKKLQAIPPAFRQVPFVAGPDRSIDEAHANAIASGMQHVARYAGSVTLDLSEDNFAELGLATGPAGEISGTTSAGQVAARMSSGNAATDLSRIRDLLSACRAKRAAKAVEAALATPTEPSTPSTPTDDVEALVTKDSATAMILDRVVGQVHELAQARLQQGQRPTIEDLKRDLEAFRPTGGPADATAFHDFNVLQVAFKHVWTNAFDENLRSHAEAVYVEATRLADEVGIEVPPFSEIADVNQLRGFLNTIATTVGGTTSNVSGGNNCVDASNEVRGAFPQVAGKWSGLSSDQQMFIEQLADQWHTADTPRKEALSRIVDNILLHPTGPGGRLAGLMLELGQMMAEPYAFDVFAPNTYNFGVLVTYRQRWEPKHYQAGDLVATIPLAPGETRTFTKKRIIKKSRAEKEAEKATSSRSIQTSETQRAEAEIMRKTSTATNFKLSSHGSFNIGIGSIDATTEFALDQQQHSQATKKDFHEATLKAAQDYRQERSLEVNTSYVEQLEETSSGTISNPNNEITVTYLFYELQRLYDVSEQLHRVRPVILVAQDVPSPHEIDEAWLIANQWIISRVLLDDSLRPALDYLTSGFAGDELGVEVLAATWKKQAELVTKLESLVDQQLAQRNTIREYIVGLREQEDQSRAAEMPLAAKIFTLGLAPDPADMAADMLEASAKAAESRLKYIEEALADAQKKLTDASAAFNQITKDYTEALQRKFSRRVAINQLRLHVKQNILYYMQAIWDHEPRDQQFFRLYNKKVKWFAPGQNCELVPVPVKASSANRAWSLDGVHVTASSQGLTMRMADRTSVRFQQVCSPGITGEERELVEIADLDNPLGYKGNYIIFPLKESCYLTSFMMSEFVDEYFGVRDPDPSGNHSIEELQEYVLCVLSDPDVSDDDKAKVKDYFLQAVTQLRPTTDTIIVPTGQLFIEALPGSHPLLEDFKLLHRIEDVRKVRADVRHAELENLRLASRLVVGELRDPDVEKQILLEKGTDVVVTDS